MDLSNYELMSKQFDCNLYCNRDEGIIYQEWLTTSYGSKYQEIMLEMLDIQKENGTTKLIVNGKDLGEMDEEDIEWTQSEYTPISVAGGLKYIAFVISDDAYHGMQQADVIVEAENGGVTSKHFNDVDEAFSWIRAK